MKNNYCACNGLKEKHQQEIISIIQKQKNVHFAWLFGSRAMGNFKENSDIDIVIEGEELTLSDVEKILTNIELTTIPYKVDVLIKHKISNIELLKHIEEYGVRWI
jgi:predicted nucleotidyltransferase